MKNFYAMALLSMLITTMGCSAQSTINHTTVPSLDLERYMGRWYELARYDHRFERNLTECEAFYTLLPDGHVSVKNTGINTRNDKLKVSYGKAKRGREPGQLRVSFFLWFYSDYNILALGEEYDWALVGSKSPNYLWILSRTPTLPTATMHHILNTATKTGYDTSKLIFVGR